MAWRIHQASIRWKLNPFGIVKLVNSLHQASIFPSESNKELHTTVDIALGMETTRRRLASAVCRLLLSHPVHRHSPVLPHTGTPFQLQVDCHWPRRIATLALSSVSSASSFSIQDTRARDFLPIRDRNASWIRCSKSSIPSASKVKGNQLSLILPVCRHLSAFKDCDLILAIWTV